MKELKLSIKEQKELVKEIQSIKRDILKEQSKVSENSPDNELLGRLWVRTIRAEKKFEKIKTI